MHLVVRNARARLRTRRHLAARRMIEQLESEIEYIESVCAFRDLNDKELREVDELRGFIRALLPAVCWDRPYNQRLATTEPPP